jgi:uncharacterized membrane protein
VRAAFETSVDHARPLGVPGPFRRAALVIGELLAAVGVVLFIPVAILAIGIPVALCVRFLIWIVGMF